MKKLYALIKLSAVLLFVLYSGYSFGQCDAPTGLLSNSTVNADGLNQIDLSWNVVGDALEYSVAYRVSGSVDPFTIKSASSNSLSVTGLPASTTYEWKVRAVCASDWSIVSPYSVLETFTTSTGESCTIPTNLASVSSGSGSSINETTLSWDAVTAADLYNVAYRIQGETSFTIKSTSTNSLTLSGLPANTTYEWRVRSVCSSDWSVVSNYSALETFTSGDGVECNAPTGVQVTSADATSFTIEWNPVAAAEQYYIQFRIPAEQSWANADDRFTFRESDKTITGLTSDKQYEARMLAICATDENGKWVSYSEYSSIVTFNTINCTTPTNLSSDPGGTSATVFWDEVPSALEYQIKYRVSGTVTYDNEVTASAGETSATLTNLSPETQYDWIIRSRCSTDNTINSPYSAVQNFTTLSGNECTTPDGLSSTPTSNDALVEWNAVPGAIDYQLKWRESGESVFLNSTIVVDPTTSYTIENLSSSTTYEWVIRARCSNDGSNDSPYSSIQTFTTAPGASCDTPTNLAASPGSTSALLSWDVVVFADQYRLKYREAGTSVFSNTVIVSAPDNSVIITGLSPSTSYEWLIRSECPDGNSSYSAIQTFTTTSSSASTRIASGDTESNVKAAESDLALEDELISKEIQQLEWKIYPNPTTNGLIYVDTNTAIDVRIYNALGQLKKVIHVEPNQSSPHNLQNLGRGLYFARSTYNGKESIKRIIVR
ncbi:MAG: fibronectin type III domain-containing protein [Fulvivirga sp.]|nr:fibronectin type III domain-containing protein [Fulvivirga sp.]